MNPNNMNDYNPGEDENQGVVTKLVQGQEANAGVSQAPYMNPVTAQGPEPEKAEVRDQDDASGDAADGINDDLLAEKAVEEGDVDQ